MPFALLLICAQCHPDEVAQFGQTGMAKALVWVADSEILRANPKMAATIGGYTYEIAGSRYSVTDGNETLRVNLEWAFGAGIVGQTFAFERDGRWYESRVSYFSALRGLDLTIGMQNITPHTLLEAAGRVVPAGEMGRCFDCHATHVARTDLARMTPGVQCERCHGETEAHVRSGAPMRKLAKLTTEEMSDFCGQCHRTWSEIESNGPHGIQNIRFQPYRLANSRCYDAADHRIACTACHNPHRALETSLAAYDAKCMACHASKPCKVAASNCASCHMPRLDLPGAHQKFTDHRIRIARPNEAYPD